MFVTLALIGPNVCSWPVTHLWSVLSAPWAPVTGSRLMASAENKRSDDCWGKYMLVAVKCLCDPFVQLWMLMFTILIFNFTNKMATVCHLVINQPCDCWLQSWLASGIIRRLIQGAVMTQRNGINFHIACITTFELYKLWHEAGRMQVS